ncbi:MAG: carbohydrate ABC transporter permease, partial [Cyanobacteria bacterium J06555_12]
MVTTRTSKGSESQFQLKLQKILSRLPLHAAIVAICILWSLPTTGLLISSFRYEDVLNDSGWWTVLQLPLDFAQFTWQNYIQV